jgi:hypothetical protein
MGNMYWASKSHSQYNQQLQYFLSEYYEGTQKGTLWASGRETFGFSPRNFIPFPNLSLESMQGTNSGRRHGDRGHSPLKILIRTSKLN